MVLTVHKWGAEMLKHENCALFTNCIVYAGNFIKTGWLEVADYMADAIRQFQLPKMGTEILAFSGFLTSSYDLSLALRKSHHRFLNGLERINRKSSDLLKTRS